MVIGTYTFCFVRTTIERYNFVHVGSSGHVVDDISKEEIVLPFSIGHHKSNPWTLLLGTENTYMYHSLS